MIGEKIAKFRKQRGYNLSELAELANISKSYLSNIERNLNKNPSLEIIIRVATALNVDIVSLLRTGSEQDIHLYNDKEWIDLVSELKELRVEKDQIHQYKILIEFIKWKNQNLE
jgi:XRE family transcriptional regulator of biofilm formation